MIVGVANTTSLARAFVNWVQKTKPDSVFLEGGFRLAGKLEGERSSACFDQSVPAESDLICNTVDPKLKVKLVVAGFDLPDQDLRSDGMPILITHCAVDRPDNLAVSNHYVPQEASLRLEEAAELRGAKQNGIFADEMTRHTEKGGSTEYR